MNTLTEVRSFGDFNCSVGFLKLCHLFKLLTSPRDRERRSSDVGVKRSNSITLEYCTCSEQACVDKREREGGGENKGRECGGDEGGREGALQC